VTDEVSIPPMPLTLNNMEVRIRTANTKTEQHSLQNVWHVKRHLDTCKTTKGAHTELAERERERGGTRGGGEKIELLFIMVCI
jgi:hypothetical protein